jgi:hypothetical protein
MPEVKVPQENGVIVITTADYSTTHQVSDHRTTVRSGELARFLSTVAGSEAVSAKPADLKKE